MRLAHIARATARATQPIVRRAPLRCLSAPAQPIDPSTSPRVTVTDSDGPHTLKFLGEQQVRVIKSELMAADKNGDGRLDAEELRALLKKHRGTFTDKEVEDLGEMFYAAKAGGSVSYDRFIHALDVKLGDEGEVGLDMGNHFKTTGTKHPLGVGKCSVEYLAGGHSVYSPEELDVKLTHTPPKTTTDKAAYYSTWLLRKGFDAATLWNIGELTQKKIMLRAIFLETIAAVPGFVGAMFRHFKALRTMERDGGWTNLLLEEAENEKMHLLAFIKMYQPGTMFRLAVIGGQCVFATFFGTMYVINPTYCHRLVGYVEEEACSTYTKIIGGIEAAPEGSELAAWRTQIAPAIGRAYWHLGEEGTVLDLMLAIRADEANHRDVNHLAAGMKPGQINPFFDPEAKLDKMLLKYAHDILDKTPEDVKLRTMGPSGA